MTNIQLADGLILLQARLSPAEQRDLWALCRALADGPVPMYTPTVRGGKKMSVGMVVGVPNGTCSLPEARNIGRDRLRRRPDGRVTGRELLLVGMGDDQPETACDTRELDELVVTLDDVKSPCPKLSLHHVRLDVVLVRC
jgi:hypothetical protein